jgi:translation initiation factor 1 (eIF-1/SUI1)
VRLNEAGTLAVEGKATITPLSADMDVAVSSLDLRPFQPYLNESVRLSITSGRLNMHSHVHYAPPSDGSPLLKFAGEVGLTNLATRDQVLFKDFVKWDALQVSGIDLTLQPNQLQLQEVKWRGLQTSIIIGPDHRPNLQTILPTPEHSASATNAATPTQAPAAAKPSAFPIQLGALVLDNAAFHFDDESIDPHAEFDVQELDGSIKGISSAEQSTATIDLRGKVDAAAPFSISGKVNPLAHDLTLDLNVAFTNTDLTAFSTYLEKYAGHPLNKGKLSMNLQYGIHEKQLKAGNKFQIDHFTLGPRNDSTNATHLPVKLAVALLKDRNGQINLDVPLTGRTDDPQFRVAPLILKVVVNLMVKAATSPFSMLGALVGGGEELSFVEFAPGRYDISDAESQKVEKLVKALDQRPALNLEIAGSFDPDKDREAMARMKLEQQIRILRLKELAEAGKPVPTIEALQLEPAQRERLLKQLIADLGTNQTVVLQSAPVPETNITATASGGTPAGSGEHPSAAKTVGSRARTAAISDVKGAAALTETLTKSAALGTKRVPKARVPTAAGGTPLTGDQIEARLIDAIKLSEEERRDLVRERAQAVQSAILKSGKIAAERLFIVTPKSASPAAKGETRANLSLN